MMKKRRGTPIADAGGKRNGKATRQQELFADVPWARLYAIIGSLRADCTSGARRPR